MAFPKMWLEPIVPLVRVSFKGRCTQDATEVVVEDVLEYGTNGIGVDADDDHLERLLFCGQCQSPPPPLGARSELVFLSPC